MKRFIAILMAATFLTLLAGCKKQYPEDIPDWLKEKIDGWIRESRGEQYIGPCGPIVVLEYSNGQMVSYWITMGAGCEDIFAVYTIDGQHQCTYDLLLVPPNDSCGAIGGISSFYLVRSIWEEKD
jgi:hypothetical protein